jgi:predicted RNA binding protein YcfA (HicA-like mRNA interferase family)
MPSFWVRFNRNEYNQLLNSLGYIMNRISDFICSYYSNSQDCPFPEVTDSKIIGAALAGLGLVSISYLCLQRQSPAPGVLERSPVASAPALDISFVEPSSRPKLLRTFESGYQIMNPGKTCPSMSDFDEDAPLLEDLLTRWTLDSGLCFFDLLGFDIYNDWKRAGADPKDLLRFCQYCNRLSVELLDHVNSPISPRFFISIHATFKSLEGKIPKTLKPKFAFLLKVLTQPNQATALGCSAVQWFGRNEILDGDRSKREDVLSFLDFACEMHPKELQFIHTTQADSTLSRKLNESIIKVLEGAPLNTQQIDLHNLLLLLKQIVDQRLLLKKIPIQRLGENIQNINSFESSKYKNWIKRTIHDHLSSAFEEKMPKVRAMLLDLRVGNLIPPNELYKAMNYLANECQSKALHSLEQQILERLDCEGRSCQDPAAYGAIFADMVRLYQIIHDIRFLKNVTKDQLEGKHIPDSFIKRAFLPSTHVLETSAAPLAAELPASLPTQFSSSSQEEVSPVPKCKVKTRPEKVEPKEEKRPQPSISESPSPVFARPDFLMRNVGGWEVIRFLLNNGFMIDRATGSHYQMKHVGTHVQTTVPYHESISPGTFNSIRDAFYRSQGFEN